MSSDPKYTSIEVSHEIAEAIERRKRELAHALAAAERAAAQARHEQQLRDVKAQVSHLSERVVRFAARMMDDETEREFRGIQVQLKDCEKLLDRATPAVEQVQSLVDQVLRRCLEAERRFELAEARRTKALQEARVQTMQVHIRGVARTDAELFAPGEGAKLESEGASVAKAIQLGSRSAEQALSRWEAECLAFVACVERAQAERLARRRELGAQLQLARDGWAGLLENRFARVAFESVGSDVERELDAAAQMLRQDRFASAESQLARTRATLESVAVEAEAAMGRAVRQNEVLQRLVAAVAAARVTLAGPIQDGDGTGDAKVRMQIGDGVTLELSVRANGSLIVSADGFERFDQLQAHGVEKGDCPGFVEWFEQIRALARKHGLDVGELEWAGKPAPVAGVRKASSRVANRASVRRLGEQK